MQLSAFCHNLKTIEKLDQHSKDLVISLASSNNAKAILSPLEHKEELWSAMAKHRIMIPREVFETLEMDDSIEMWTSERNFMFAMGPILMLTSYSPDDLNSQPWDNLFQRDEAEKEKILNRLLLAFSSGQPQLDVTDWHPVQEVSGLKQTLLVKVKLLSPFQSKFGYSGIIAVVKSKPLSASDLNQ